MRYSATPVKSERSLPTRRVTRGTVALLVVCAALLVGAGAFFFGDVDASGAVVLSRASGHGTVTAPSGTAREWSPRMPLAAGDVLEVSASGSATIEGAPDLRILVGPGTRVVWQGMGRRRADGRCHARVSLEKGRAWLFVRNPHLITLNSPLGEARLLPGASVEVAVDGEAMKLSAWRGEAAYVAEDMKTAEYVLAEGQQLVADRHRGENRIEHLDRTHLDAWQKASLAQLQ